MVEIIEVKTKKEQKEFLDFPLKMYKDNNCFVPPLYSDEKKIFNKNYVYNDTCESVFFLAKENDKVVGRISGIIQKAYNQKHNEKRVRFTRFDCIDNQEIANQLFESVEDWAKQKGMDTICGPLGYSDLEREGLLIYGFDELSTFEEQYNHAYYQNLVENYGFKKEVDWEERKLYAPDTPDEKLYRVSSILLEKNNLKFARCKNINEFIKKYAEKMFKLIDETYVNIYGTVPFTDATRDMMIKNFKLVLDLKHVAVIVDENDDVVSFGIAFPSMARAVQKSQGHLTIPCLFRLLRDIHKPKIIDLGLIGVSEKYAMKGISSALTAEIMKMLYEPNIQYAETNLNLEDNAHILNQWNRFKAVLHKKRRAYIKQID